jgi:hypothetical protein
MAPRGGELRVALLKELRMELGVAAPGKRRAGARGGARGGRRMDRAVVSGDGGHRGRPGGQGQEQGPRPRTRDKR